MHVKQLDGLRIFCFLGVFICHHAVERFWYMGYGLGMFFVLSGFLITRSLLEDETGQFGGDLFRFYVRRGLRIFPVYYLLIAILTLFGALPFAAWHFAYLFNIKLFMASAVGELGFLDNWKTSGIHFWSLCVEEQFYLVYPLLFLSLRGVARPVFLGALLVLSIVARTLLAHAFPATLFGALLPVSGEYLVWGCLFYCLHSRGAFRSVRAVYFLYGGFALASTLLIFGPADARSHWLLYFHPTFRQSIAGLSMAMITLGLWLDSTTVLARFLSTPPLVYLGKMTYGFYLVHLFTFDLFDGMVARWPVLQPVPPFIGRLVLTAIPVILSWHFYELPIYRLKRFVTRPAAIAMT